jgi:hypothetical protein
VVSNDSMQDRNNDPEFQLMIAAVQLTGFD